MRIELFNRPLDICGQVSQNVALGWHDQYDTENGFNAAIWTGLFEGAYHPSRDLKIFGQFILTGDLIYGLKASDESWNQKGFADSWRRLALDDKYWQIVKEFHVTWTPGPLLVRAGKQIISWGETDGIRLIDQINPQDLRRGFSDVEFETTIIPVWLLRADYSAPIHSTWLHDLNFQVWFNPNADFIPSENIAAGNNVGGIWAPYVEIPIPVPGKTLLGSSTQNLETPDQWTQGHEFGGRIQGMVEGSLVSINGFYGRENNPLLLTAAPSTLEMNAAPGINLLHPDLKGYYPYLRFVGGTFSRDLTFLQRLLFGISPVLRLETFYAFDSSFVGTDPMSGIESIQKHNEVRWAIGLDWKVRIPMISPSGISIQPQFFQQHIFGVPPGVTLASPDALVKRDNYNITLFLRTAYLNERLPVSFFWLRDITGRAGFIKPDISYLWDKNWSVEVGAMFFNGDLNGVSYDVFKHKNYFFTTVTYKWG